MAEPMMAKEVHDPRMLVALHRDFMDEVEPLLRLKTYIYQITLPRILVSVEGTEVTYHFTDEQQKYLDNVDELIALVRRRYERSVYGN